MDIGDWDNDQVILWLAKEGFSGLCVLKCKGELTGAALKTLTREDLVTKYDVDKKEAKKIVLKRDKLLKVKVKGAPESRGWLRTRLGIMKQGISKDSSGGDISEVQNNSKDKVSAKITNNNSNGESISGSKTSPSQNPRLQRASRSEIWGPQRILRKSTSEVFRFKNIFIPEPEPAQLPSSLPSQSSIPSQSPLPLQSPLASPPPSPSPPPQPRTTKISEEAHEKESTPQNTDSDVSPEWKAYLEKTAVLNVRRESDPSRQPSPRPDIKTFGAQLELVLNRQKKLYPTLQIPIFVETAVQYITKYGLKENDIFKAAVPHTKVKDIKAKIDAGTGLDISFAELLKYIDANIVAELLKDYLRELPSPLIPPKILGELQEALTLNSDEMRRGLRLLPDPSYYLIERMMGLLRNVSKNNFDNGMDAESLSDIFGPIFFAQSMIHEDEGIDLICAWIEGYPILFPQKQGSALAIRNQKGSSLAISVATATSIPKNDDSDPTKDVISGSPKVQLGPILTVSRLKKTSQDGTHTTPMGLTKTQSESFGPNGAKKYIMGNAGNFMFTRAMTDST